MTYYGKPDILKKKKIISSKPSEVITITSKKYWVVLNNKNKLVYNKDGSIALFSRRKEALEYIEIMGEPNYKIEKLDVIITK